VGQFDDLRSSGGKDDEIVIGWECEPVLGEANLEPGDFDDASGPITYYASYGPGELKQVHCTVRFSPERVSPQSKVSQLQPQLNSVHLGGVMGLPDNKEMMPEVRIQRRFSIGSNEFSSAISSTQDELLRSTLDFEVILDTDSMEEVQEDFVSARPVGCGLYHFLPSYLTLRVNMAEEEKDAIINALSSENLKRGRQRVIREREIVIPKQVLDVVKREMDADTYNRMFNVPTQLELVPSAEPAITIGEWYDRVRRLFPISRRQDLRKSLGDPAIVREIRDLLNQEGPKERISLVRARQPTAVASYVNYTEYYFSKRLKYLGPLRDEPKALYPLATGTDPYDVGLRGEFTASVLDLHKNRPTTYIPSSVFNSPELNLQPITRTLQESVVDWLQYLGVASNVETEDRGKLGHELRIVPLDLSTAQDLTHVGVGVSQVLPILVSCLLSSGDSTLIVEQPELHLHPLVQSLLGDFFLSMALLNKQCVIETHSEYLINRLRFRVASASPTNPLTHNVVLYFVEKKLGSSNYRHIKINEYGAILQWPEGFFDQSQAEAEKILKAATQKRRILLAEHPNAERDH
jgi:predicted ATPase